MENSNKHTVDRIRRRPRADRHGKITLVTIIAILGLIVLAGFVGNAGQVVTAKVASQNAADAVAFSSAQWMARGMNAATATNHMIGEVTGLVVVIEALGGPEVDQKMEDYSPQNMTLDTVIKTLKDTAPANGGYGASALGSAEKPVIKLLVDQMAPEDQEKRKSKAFATIYDSKLELKMDLSKRLLIKTVANLGFMVPPPWGFISAAIAYAAHLVSDAQIVLIGKEWFILEGIEFVVKSAPVRELKGEVLEDLLIPAIAAHGDFIAGNLDKTTKQKKKLGGDGIVSVGVGDALLHLGKTYGVTAFTFPVAKNLPMPVEPEPAPSEKGTTTGNEPEWGKDEVVSIGGDSELDDIKDNVRESKSKIQDRIDELKQGVQLMDRLKADIDKLAQKEGVTADERKEFDKEKTEIARARAEKLKRIADLEKELQELKDKESEINKTVNSLEKMPPGTGNLSAKPAHLALEKMKQSEERYTQWVRATYPYVDSFRAAILKQFEEHLERSEAAKHYEKWTNRYTLTKAWQFRSGYRFKAKQGSKTDGEWTKKQDAKLLEMYVMKGAYDSTTPKSDGNRHDVKGHEAWTEDSATGKEQAESLFTIIGLTHRDVKPLFSPVIYPVASRNGVTTFAQAIFYNGNEQQAAPTKSKLKTQAKLGWDTLNWDPGTNVPEWGTKLASSRAKWPWELFTQSSTLSGFAKVHLNWQAKLMPVTQTRLKGAVTMPMSVDMNTNVSAAVYLFNKLISH